MKVTINGYETLPAGRMWLNQVWSGDMLNAVISYLPEGTTGEVLSYWYQRAGGPVFNDCICVGVDAAKPVMAHRFMNYMLDPKVALRTSSATSATSRRSRRSTPNALFEQQLLPENLRNTRRHARGLRERQRVPRADGGRAAGCGTSPGASSATADEARVRHSLALPGMAWLAAFFLVAFYAIVAVGFGNVTDVYEPVPHWNPLDWNVGYILQALEDVAAGRAHVGRLRAHAALRRARASRSRWRSATRSPTTSRATRTGARRSCCWSCWSRRSGSRT